MKSGRSQIKNILESLINNEVFIANSFHNYSPAGVKKLLVYFGNPHRRIKSIHIAGTNGKGSVATMLEAIFRANGYRTGLYTSPHLLAVNERIRLGNVPIPDSALLAYLEELLHAAGRVKTTPTYFDALTIAAFRYFRDSNTDISIVETGLGGTMDSTNVIRPLVSVLTSISRDHVPLLGSDLPSIAENKAGIVKSRVPVITSNTAGPVMEVIHAKARSTGSTVYCLNEQFRIRTNKSPDGTHMLHLKFGNYRFRNIVLPLPGRHQAFNAALAIAAALLAAEKGFVIKEEHIRDALSNIVIPGRMEILSSKPLIIFDPAHNAAAVNALFKTLASMYPSRPINAVISIMKDKEYRPVFNTAGRYARGSLLYFNLPDPRALRLPSGVSDTAGLPSCIAVDGVAGLYSALKKVSSAETVTVFTGSFRLYETARKAAAQLNLR